MKAWLKILFTAVIIATITGCSFFDKDNSEPPHPLTNFIPALTVNQLWTTLVGNGAGGQYLEFTPAVLNGVVYANSQDGHVQALDSHSGRLLWQRSFRVGFTSGVATGSGVLVMGLTNGQVAGFDQNNGQPLWNIDVGSQVLALPTIVGNTVLVKTLASKVVALNIKTGKIRWSYDEQQSQVQLRGGSSPQVRGDLVIVGFPNGMIDAFHLNNGSLAWQRLLAPPQNSGSFIQQMVDIDSNPVIVGGVVYVAGYQGNLAALDLTTGNDIWQQPFSSYSGMVVRNNFLYIVSASGHVIALNRNHGTEVWRQTQLQARGLSAPTLFNNAVVVGDAFGYVHWLATSNGDVIARSKIGDGAILATPIVADNKLFVMDSRGVLAVYQSR